MNQTVGLIQRIEEDKLWEKKIRLNRKEYLKVAGSIDRNLYYVISGSLQIFVMDEFEENIIRFGYQHNIITSLDSFISGTPSEYYIQALKKTELKVIGKSALENLIETSDDLRQNWIKILEQIIFQQLERERDILTASPLERYKRVFKRSPQLFQEIPNKYIASYLRMSPETLSRIKKR